MMMPTKVNFNDSIFQEYPDRLYMYLDHGSLSGNYRS